MPSATAGYAPDLEKYLKSLKGQPLELSIENLISYEPLLLANLTPPPSLSHQSDNSLVC
jgi:hypothetical protein